MVRNHPSGHGISLLSNESPRATRRRGQPIILLARFSRGYLRGKRSHQRPTGLRYLQVKNSQQKLGNCLKLFQLRNMSAISEAASIADRSLWATTLRLIMEHPASR